MTKSSEPEITLRAAEERDEAFVLELYAGTRAAEMALVPWTQEQKSAFVRAQFLAQQDHYQQKFPDATRDIVSCGDRSVGHLHVARLPEEIRIVDLIVSPGVRKKGIGSTLIRRVQAEATSANKAVTVYVETFNDSLVLFEKLGFVRAAEHGMHFLMRWKPAPDRSAR